MIAPNLIGGCWKTEGETFPSIDPSTGEILGQAVSSTEDDVSQAVIAANSALPEWSLRPIGERAELVGAVASELLKEYGDEGRPTRLKSLISNEMGKRLPESDIEVVESADILSFYAKHGPACLQDRHLALDAELWPSKQSIIKYSSVGVVGIIKPWNYPLELPIWTLGAALITGNTVVLKPSELAPLTGTALAELFEKVGFPNGVVNLVNGGKEVGRSLVHNNSVDMISFTGSSNVGREIAVVCAEKMKRCSLELGGKDAMIVLPDADLDLAANGATWGSFTNCGQVCVGVKRILVAREVYSLFLERFLQKVEALRLGIDIGPVVSQEQLEKVELHIRDAVARGAVILTGGSRSTVPDSPNGFYFEPTVISGVDNQMLLSHADTFGPVVFITQYDDLDETIRELGNNRYDLGASVWTSNIEVGCEIARQLPTGMVWINDVNVAFPQAPWCGRRWSGHGIELSELSLYEYSVPQHINAETGHENRRAWWFPYEG